VLAEAFARGTPVVSTDCPHGPVEILDHGPYGLLVPVGDPAALTRAILATPNAPPPSREFLEDRGESFSVSAAAVRYLGLFEDILPPSATARPSDRAARGRSWREEIKLPHLQIVQCATALTGYLIRINSRAMLR